MKRIITVIILLLIASLYIKSQDVKGDSLKPGRVCKLILYNGYQAEGRITERKKDTLAFETDIVKLFIPVKDIKFVLNPEVELSDIDVMETIDTINYVTMDVFPLNTKMTDECEVYMQDKSVLSGIKLIKDTDSTLKTFKDDRYKVIRISDIRKIVFKPSVPFLKGALIGGGIGFLVGFLPVTFSKGTGHPDYSGPIFGLFFGTVLAIPAALVGGVMGLLMAVDEIYTFKRGINPDKLKSLKQLMEKHY
jgi:hypothetical protein